MCIDYLMDPIELSRSEEKIIDGEYDFSFITTDEHLRGLVSNICNELKHPITLININKKSDFQDKRLDSDSVYYALRTACDTLRICASSKLCKECDEFHSSVFKGKTKNNLEYELNASINNLPKFHYATKLYQKPKVLKSKNDRCFVSYDCPMLGYRELIFPVFFEDKVIAVLFVGQIRLEENDIHKKTTEQFLESYSYVFDHYINSSTSVNIETIAKHLKKSDFKYDIKTPFENIYNEPVGSINDIRKNKLNKEEFNNLIENVCEQLLLIEDFLIKHMDNKRKSFFCENIKKKEDEFFLKINPLDFSVKNLDRSWECFCEYLLELKEILCFENIYAYKEEKIDKDITICKSKKYQTIFDPNISFNFNIVEEYINSDKYLPTLSITEPLLFRGLRSKYGFNETNSILIVFSNLAIIIPTKIHYNEKHKHIFRVMLSEFAGSLANIYFSIQNIYLGYFKSKYQMTLRLYRHECQHISKGMSNKNDKYFNNNDKDYIKLSRKKTEDIYNDFNSSISLINGMASSIGLIIGTIDPRQVKIETTDVSIFKEILYKWTDMFHLSLAEKNLQIIVPDVSRFDKFRPFSINTNKELLEQVVYNIVDNAVKYAHYGSKIYIDFRRPFVNSSIGTLSVTNYGPYGIDEDDDPYELYYRSSLLQGEIEGEGIGLFVAKKITNLFDMHIYHTSKQISDYGISLIPEYLNREFSIYEKDNSLIEVLNKEVEKLENKSIEWQFDTIVNRNKPTPVSYKYMAESALITNVKNPTYIVTFNIDIKLKN